MRNLDRLFCVLLFALMGCSTDDKDNVLGSIAGTNWVGQYQELNVSAPKNVIPVSFKFSSDNNFRTLSLDNVAKSAQGSYRDMPRHNTVLLDVKESTFEKFSLKGSSKAFEYSLADDELVLKNNEGIYTLVREAADGKDPTNHFFGSWACKDPSEGEWGIDLDANSFFGRRTQKGTRALNIEGTVSYVKSSETIELPDIAEITLNSSNQGDLKGLRLRAQMPAKNTKNNEFTMNELDELGEVKEGGLQVKCGRG